MKFPHSFFGVVLLFSSAATAQSLTVHAGPDTVICGQSFASFNIGSNAVVSGGQAPYSYQWSTEQRDYVDVDFTQYPYPVIVPSDWANTTNASDFLTDTTALNTTFNLPSAVAVPALYPGLDFYLTVTDSLGEQVTDTMQVAIGGFIVSTLNGTFVPGSDNLQYGDTIHYGVDQRISGYLPLVSSEWSPQTSEIVGSPFDFEIEVVANDASFDYASFSQTLVDVAGCSYVFSPYDMMQYPLEVASASIQPTVKAYPNPTAGVLTISGVESSDVLTIRDAKGALVSRWDFNPRVGTLEMEVSGNYFLTIDSVNGGSQTIQFSVIKP